MSDSTVFTESSEGRLLKPHAVMDSHEGGQDATLTLNPQAQLINSYYKKATFIWRQAENNDMTAVGRSEEGET